MQLCEERIFKSIVHELINGFEMLECLYACIHLLYMYTILAIRFAVDIQKGRLLVQKHKAACLHLCSVAPILFSSATH